MNNKHIVKRALETGALKIDANNFFHYKGLNKPIYHRFDLLFFDYQDREDINKQFIGLVDKLNVSVDFFATTSNFGTIIAANLANYYNKNFVFLRDSMSEFGKRYKIDCAKNLSSLEGKKAVLIDIMNVNGYAIARSVFALNEVGVSCNHIITLFDYSIEISKKIFGGTEPFNLKGSKLPESLNVNSIFNLETLLDIAIDEKYIDNKQKERIMTWRDNCK